MTSLRPLRDEPTRALVKDLLAAFKRSDTDREVIVRCFIDPLPFWRGVQARLCFALAPRQERPTPFKTSDVLAELIARRIENGGPGAEDFGVSLVADHAESETA